MVDAASTHVYGSPAQRGRGVSASDVERAADALLREGQRPTAEKVRERLGGGSPNTIYPLLDAWWARLAARLDAGPPALHRLPESVVHVVEALWLQVLEEARSRVAAEQARAGDRLERREREIEVRSHVLTLREGELEERLRERERTIEMLRARIRDLETQRAKERAVGALRATGSPRRSARTSQSRAHSRKARPHHQRPGGRRTATAGGKRRPGSGKTKRTVIRARSERSRG